MRLAATTSVLLHAFIAAAALNVVTLRPFDRDVAVRAPDEIVEVAPPLRIERRARRSARATPAASAAFAMRGRRVPLRRGQGYYTPVASWMERGVRAYRVAYEFEYRDGRIESGIVPWTVSFPPGRDPFARGRSRDTATIPLPPPPADYVPPGTLGKALRAYFPGLQFED